MAKILKVRSKELKGRMLTHMLYRLHYAAAITEYGGRGSYGIADLYGITDAGFTHEFEVKVDRGDLMGELKAIKFHSAPQQKIGEERVVMSKSGKHGSYLSGYKHGGSAEYEYGVGRPNKFSFVVTEALAPLAKEWLKGTPYGIFQVCDGGPECIKKADYLHKEKAGQVVWMNILRKACTEVETLRGKDFGNRCSHCEARMPGRCDKCEGDIAKSRRQTVCYRRAIKGGEYDDQAYNACMMEPWGKQKAIA